MQWQTVIGLEVHAQLNTASKIFSASPTLYGQSPNSQASFIDLGLPGTLPVLNQQAVYKAIKFGLAINATINKHSVFERKNYFYPDLPKGYQTSQFASPIVIGGHVDIQTEAGDKRIQLTRAHLEEDAGKLNHLGEHSGVDLNRAGTPLLEIVTEPVIDSAEEAIAYLKTLHTLVKYLDICDGNMQEGSFRCDVNISIKPKDSDTLGTRTEIKNVNSFRFIEKAIRYEEERHKDILETGGEIVQETRLYNENKEKTVSMRSKEEANDYRYFPCPDLLPVELDDKTIEEIKSHLPELANTKRQRFINSLEVSEEDASLLTQDKALADYFELTLEKTSAKANKVANWIKVELLGHLNKQNLSIEQSPVSAEHLAELLDKIHDKSISGKMAKTVFEKMLNDNKRAEDIIKEEGLSQIDDDSVLIAIIDKIIENNPKQVEQFLGGKDKLLGFFVGQIMKETKGQANPQKVNELLQAAFDKKK